jgi:hypothetical protein
MNTKVVAQTAAVLLISFAIKLAYLQERRQLPDFAFPSLDAKFHDDWAVGLATGQWSPEMAELRDGPYFRAPLYPYLVSFVYRVFGRSYDVWLLAQIVLGSVSALLMFLFSRAVFGNPAAWVAFGLYLTYWPITYYEAERLMEVLLIFLDTSFLLSAVWAGRQGRPMAWMLPGLLLGLSAITRPNILVVIPFMLWWIHRRTASGSDRQLLRVLCFVVATVAVITPVTLRNVIVGHDVVLIASQGGVNFYIGNNVESNGVRAVVPGTRGDWWGGFRDANRMADEARGGGAYCVPRKGPLTGTIADLNSSLVNRPRPRNYTCENWYC